MTIEEVLSRLAINTGRIAAALEALVESQGIVSTEKPSNNLDLFDDENDESEEDQPKPAAKKKTKKKAKKKVSKKKAASKADDDDDVSLTIADDVRPVLKKLREEVSHAAVKTLLKRYGADTLKDLKPAQYAAIIAEAKDELGSDDLDDDEDDI